MKKVLCALLILGIILTSSFTAFAATVGDVNSDGKINSADALGILQHTVGSKPKNFNKDVADINSDGKINSSDALVVLQIAVGSIKPPMSKDEIVKLYNDSIEKVSDQSKCKLTISSNVDITVNKILSDGKEDPTLKDMFEQLVGTTTNEEEKFTFYKGKTLKGETAEEILAAILIETSQIKSATAVKYADGYKLTFRFFDEDIDMNEVAGADAPVEFEDYTVTVTNTELVAITDGKGRIISINLYATANMKASTSVSPDSPSLYMDLSMKETKNYKFTY